MKKTFEIEVDCANCASKCEDAIRSIKGVISVNINFMTQKMTIEAENSEFDSVLKQAEKTAKKVERDFCIIR